MSAELPTVSLTVSELDATVDPPRVILTGESIEQLRPLARRLGERVDVVLDSAVYDAATLLASERTTRLALEDALGKAERERDALSQVAVEAIRLVHGSELGDHYSHEPCGECGLGGHGAIRDALTKALGPGYTKLVWGNDMNIDWEKWAAALAGEAEGSG